MNAAAIYKLRQQLELIRRIAGEETTIAQAIVLLEVALHPGEKITHLTAKLSTDGTHTLVSRTADRLGSFQGPRVAEPAGLLERRDFEGDRRAKALYLTKRGERLMERLS